MKPLGSQREGADLVLRDGSIVTVDARFSVAEAVAIVDGKIAAVGTEQNVMRLAGPDTRVIGLQGGTVLPGINDSHLHLAMFGLSRPPFSLDLTPGAASTVAEVRRLVAERAAELPMGTWIRGEGWDRTRLKDLSETGRGPTREDLDDVAPRHPVVLWDWTHHAVWANSAALAKAGIERNTPEPHGGRIVRDCDGRPTGELLESAQNLVLQAASEPSAEERRLAIESATAELTRLGVTSITDPAVWPVLLRDYIHLNQEGRLGLRLNVLLNWDWPSVTSSVSRLRKTLNNTGLASGLGDDRLRVRGAKLFADGVPGLGTAWMSEPYAGGVTGSLVTAGKTDEERRDELLAMIDLLHRHRLQVQVHATGDRACAATVEGFVRAMEKDPWPDARHVLIHGNFVSDSDAALLASYGLVANVNSLIKRRAGDATRPLLDESRWHRNIPVRTLIEAGVHVADASDAPIVYPDWRQAMESLILRECAGSGAVSGPDQRLDRQQAIRAWTIEPAYQDGMEHIKGSIEVGKLADLVVLAEDIMQVEDHDLHALTPTMTVLGGEIVHEVTE